MDNLPDEIMWPEYGIAKRLLPRGMSDYQRGEGNAIYKTELGASLYYSRGKWRAQYKGLTTQLKETPEEAMEALGKDYASCETTR